MTLDNLYQFDDPLFWGDFQSGLSGPSGFSLSAWESSGNGYDSDDLEDDEDNSEGDNHICRWSCVSKVPEKNRSATAPPTAAKREGSAGSSCPAVSTSCARITRVRFLEVPEIRLYEGVDKEHLATLFYSCHELQKMIDEAKNEKETKNTV